MQVKDREGFEACARSAASIADVENAARRAKADGGDAEARLTLAAAFYHAAFAAPELIAQTYDAAARGWFGGFEAPAIAIASFPPAQPPASLWADFWALLDSTGQGLSALDITGRTAALAIHVPPEFQARSAAASAVYPGVREAAALGMPPRFTMAELARCPAGSLGNDFYRQITENGFDLEVLDRDALGVAALTPPLDYLNARVLQIHDLIHLTAGYDLSPLHEVGISAFQMAQFGHGYSSMFLALVTTATAGSPTPGAFTFMLNLILTAWVHGRQSPQLLAVAWETVWNEPVDTVRTRIGIKAFADPARAIAA